jgi:hypothetical protein
VSILGETWEIPDEAWRDRWNRCLVEGGSSARRLDHAVADPYRWTSAVTIKSIEARAGDLLMFHAAGLSTPDGAVVALAGPSGTGKSTVSRTLCREGFGYVTDETVAVREDGSVIPFEKPIAVVPEGGGPKIELGPDELGLTRCPGELWLQGLVVLDRHEDHGEPSIEAMDLPAAIAAVVPHVSALPQLPGALNRLAGSMDACGGTFRIRYREAAQIGDMINEVLAAEPICSDYDWLPPDSGQVESTGALVRRAPYRDALRIDGRVIVLLDSTCLQLQGIGSLIWLAAARPRAVSELVEEMVAQLGDHPDAPALVQDAVDELAAQGALAT